MIYQKPESIIPVNDEARLKKLYDYGVLATILEDSFEKIANLAAQIFNTPNASVTFVDKERVLYKANINAAQTEVNRDRCLCSYAILENEPTVFNDTHQVPDFKEKIDNSIRFYAAAPLKSPEGFNIGTVSVTDSVPRLVTEVQLKMLVSLASIIMDELDLRLATRKAIRVQTDFMNMVVHDLKNPLTTISLYSQLVGRQKNDSDRVEQMSIKINSSVKSVLDSLNSMLNASQIEDGFLKLNLESQNLENLLTDVKSDFELQLKQKKQQVIIENRTSKKVKIDKARIREVFENLLSNAIKYSYSNKKIKISIYDDNQSVIVEMTDQGQGLDENDIKNLFVTFARLSSVPTAKERSNGLGLFISKTLIGLHSGSIWAKSPGKNMGTSFYVSLPVESTI